MLLLRLTRTVSFILLPSGAAAGVLLLRDLPLTRLIALCIRVLLARLVEGVFPAASLLIARTNVVLGAFVAHDIRASRGIASAERGTEWPSRHGVSGDSAGSKRRRRGQPPVEREELRW